MFVRRRPIGLTIFSNFFQFSDEANQFSNPGNWVSNSTNPKKQLAELGNRLAISENQLTQ